MYRETESAPPACPRCKKALPPLDVATCGTGTCGTWVSAFAAPVVLTDTDRKPDPVTRWWRVRAPCPICSDKMLLHGSEPGLLIGCAGHGYWIDADTVAHTGLARGVDQAALDKLRDDSSAVDAAREQAERALLDRAKDKAAKDLAEAAVRGMKVTGAPDHPPSVLSIASAVLMPTPATLMMLAEKIGRLESRNAALEQRVAALEAHVRR